MSWVTVIWAMVAGACLTLGGMHFLVWCRNRTMWASLLFTATAVATAGVAACELWMMRAESTREFGVALRWLHVPAWVLIVSLVGFVRVYLRAGRPWLAWAVCGMRTASLALNFVFTPNLNYREISALRHIRFLGETVSAAEGVPNPWMLVGQASFLLLLVFVVDALLTVWRRNDRRRARLLAAATVFFVATGTLQIVLALWGIIHMPVTPSLFFLGVVVAMGYEISFEVRRAAQLSDDLQESEARMAMAAEAAGFGVWMWSIARQEVWGSERWLSLFGFTPEAGAVRFEQVMQRIHPDDRDRVEREVRRTLVESADYAGEYRVVLPDGTQRWVAARGRMHPDRHGRPARMLGAAIDITRRKRAELEIVQQRNELAHVGRVSTMGQLASALAHELSQPLGAILRNAEAAELFMQSDPPDLEEVRAILADIRKDDQRAGEIIDHMRALLKRRGLERVPLNLAEVVEEVVPLVQPDAVNRRVKLEVEVPKDLPPVRGDRVQLQQVLLNLILNGMDAMNELSAEARRLRVRVRQSDAGTIEVAVADAGRGVPAEKLARLFEPFFTTKPEGMGLGLPISSTIIEAHGGRIWAQNSPAGATFFFTVPVAAGDK